MSPFSRAEHPAFTKARGLIADAAAGPPNDAEGEDSITPLMDVLDRLCRVRWRLSVPPDFAAMRTKN